MKKFIIFFLLNFSLYSQNKETKKILKYIKNLSQRRIIENIQVDEKELLNKGDFITTLYRVLKSIDKSKVSKGDLNIIENMLYEITNFINKFKVEIDENTKKFVQLKEEFNKLREELLKKIENNAFRIDSLEKVLKTQFEMENSIKEFLKEYKFNLTNDISVFSNLYNYKDLNFKWSLSTKVSKGKNNFKFFYNKEFSKNPDIVFKGELFPINDFGVYMKNYSHTFVSPFNQIFYSDYVNYSTVIGIKNSNIVDMCILNDSTLNLLANVDLNYFFLSSYLTSDYIEYIKYNFLEIGTKVPLFKDTFWLGAAFLKENLEGYFADFCLAYLSDSLNLKLYYKDNFSSVDRKRKLKVNTNYTFSTDFVLGLRGIINFPNLDPAMENILEAWEFFMNTKGQVLNLDLSINSRKMNDRNEIFLVVISNLKYSDFNSKIGFILKDNINNNPYRLCLLVRGEYFIYEHLNLYIQYIKSNFEYHNNETNLEGKRYNILFNKIRETIQKDQMGILSLGFKLNI